MIGDAAERALDRILGAISCVGRSRSFRSQQKREKFARKLFLRKKPQTGENTRLGESRPGESRSGESRHDENKHRESRHGGDKHLTPLQRAEIAKKKSKKKKTKSPAEPSLRPPEATCRTLEAVSKKEHEEADRLKKLIVVGVNAVTKILEKHIKAQSSETPVSKAVVMVCAQDYPQRLCSHIMTMCDLCEESVLCFALPANSGEKLSRALGIKTVVTIAILVEYT